MNIGELFISLGIKGAEKTLNALSNVKDSISKISSTSLEAKAAILGIVYALEQLTTGSAKEGAHLQNFSAYLDMSVESLEKWRYAAKQGGISNQEFDASLKSIYDHIKDYNTSGKLPFPELNAIFAQETQFDFTKPFKTEDILPKLLEFSQNKNYSKNIIEKILDSWGLSPSEIGSAIEGRFNAANVANAPFLKESEVNKLSKINVEWENLEAKVQMFFDHFTAKNGEEIVTTLSKLADKFLSIANSIEKISSHAGIFKTITQALEAMLDVLNVIISPNKENAEKSFASFSNNPLFKYTPEEIKKAQEKEKLLDDTVEKWNDKLNGYNFEFSPLKSIKENILRSNLYLNPPNNKDFTDIYSNLFNFLPSNQGGIIAPPTPLLQKNSTPNNITLNQNLNFQHEGKDIIQTRNSFGTAIVEASRMFTANSRLT